MCPTASAKWAPGDRELRAPRCMPTIRGGPGVDDTTRSRQALNYIAARVIFWYSVFRMWPMPGPEET
jgi:hypothetical protein